MRCAQTRYAARQVTRIHICTIVISIFASISQRDGKLNFNPILITRLTMLKRTALATTAAFATSAFAIGHSKDIVDTAAAAGSFTTLLAAAEAAGLVETLKGKGPLTVFAPTDEAFAALSEGTVETVLLPENRDLLVAILTYHVIAGAVMSGDLSDDMTAATVQGADITIDLDYGVMVDDANVVTADIEASNGVIHVIDKVIMPAM